MRTSSNLRAVRRAASRVATGRDELERAIHAARAEGATLREIAEAAGVSAQRVHQITGRKQ